jgi:uncharacterized membrane protein YbhN (UPF0104 family)
MTHQRKRWRRLRRVVFAVFLIVACVLLVRYAQSVDWPQVASAMAGYDAGTLSLAGALVAASYLLFCAYDLAARRYSHHALPTGRVMAVAFTSYAFGLNIGALVGGVGFRYRLYSHAGLTVGTISRIVAFSVATNWLGYLLLAGLLFASGQVRPPPQWNVDGAMAPWLGWMMLAATAVYTVACRITHGRVLHLRGHHFRLPSLPMALLQFSMAALNWAVTAALLYVLMPQGVDYAAVLGALLLAAVASAIAHIPAGIGVLEAVVLAMLGHLAPAPALLAALLAYRACYYLVPLLVGLGMYAALETHARGAAARPGTS